MLRMVLICIYLFPLLEVVAESEISIVFIILSQNTDYDARKASRLYDSLKAQTLEITNLRVDILKTHENFPEVVGAWAIWPMLQSLYAKYGETAFDWMFICEADTTMVNVTGLVQFLNSFNRYSNYAIGRGLVDETQTIIHHFFDYGGKEQFLYPDLAAGLALSWNIFKDAKILERSGFSIDAKHEFARLLKDEHGLLLNNTLAFCLLEKESHCITRYVQPLFQCSKRVTNEDVYFAIKTFSGFHKTRLVVVKRTWAKTAKYVEYFSDVEDHYVPTVDLGIENTKGGHCGKTFGIFAYYLNHEEMLKTQWLVVADDDTLMSVPRVYKMLSCYDPQEELIIGERYGYGFSVDGRQGYDYPTGGAGMIFSRKAVEKVVASCGCPSNDSPDDMIIGMCARRHGIPVIHSAAFHQAQPQDYPKLYLDRIQPISFHKFGGTDPYEIYMKRLHDASTVPASRPHHSEL